MENNINHKHNNTNIKKTFDLNITGLQNHDIDGQKIDNKPNDIDLLIAKANSGDAEAQYNLSVHYLQSDNVDDQAKAFEYCYASHKNGYSYAAFNLGLMHLNGTSPIFDAIYADYLFEEAKSYGESKAEKNLNDLHDEINTYAPFARTFPQLSINEVPHIKGVLEALNEFQNTPNCNGGSLCGRLGSLSNYPMIELKRSHEFQAINGMKLEDHEPNGLCLHLTFVQISHEPARASIEEAYYFQIFKHLDIFKEFNCFFTLGAKASDGTVANAWEYVVDCGNDLEKAERIASSILYHIYGYKNNSFMHPSIKLDLINGGMLVQENQNSDYNFPMFLWSIETFNWIDALIIAIGILASFIFSDDTETTIVWAVIITVCMFFYGTSFTAKLKKIKNPKRNYIRFLRNPNTPW